MVLSRRLLVGGLVQSLGPFYVANAANSESNSITIALSALPPGKGNAFTTNQAPTILLTGGIFDGLTRMTKDGQVMPWLATSWKLHSELTWRFRLREDIVFSNGKPFNAAAVEHTVNYLSGPGPVTEGLRRDFNFLDRAVAVDDFTVDITTKIPVPMFPRYATVLLIVEPTAWQKMSTDEFARNPVGTGPLIIKEWGPAKVLAEANKLSWRQTRIDQVEFIAVPDKTARIQGIMSGEIDISYDCAPDDFPVIESIGGNVLSIRDGSVASIMLQFGQDNENPLNDKRVRHALNYAVNKKAIVDVFFDGQTVEASQPAARSVYGYNENIEAYDFNITKALQLMKAAGYDDGFEITLTTSGTGTNGELIVQTVAQDLLRIGVKVKLVKQPIMQFIIDFVRGRITSDAFTWPWVSYPILDSIYTTKTNSCMKVNGWYCNPEIQPVIDQAWVEGSPEKAIELRKQIMSHYHEEAPSIFLYEYVGFAGMGPRIKEFDQVFGYINFDKITLK